MNLSVIIPTYKRSDALKRNLESLISSKVNCDEVIIGDDGGDKETLQVCAQFSTLLPIIRLAPEGKGSLAKNITRLLKAAKGKWVLLIHDDDFLTGDHSAYPNSFDSQCDFFFSDHWICDESGVLNITETEENSIRYGRNTLKEGLQSQAYELLANQAVCLDGFYLRSSCVKNIYPSLELGSVADYFWIYQILSSGLRIWFSKARTFVYTLSTQGLTAQGLNEDTVKGYHFLKEIETDVTKRKFYDYKISLNTWYAVNACLRRGEKRKAWELLKSIRFIYRHSLKQQLLLPVQIFWLLLPKRN